VLLQLIERSVRNCDERMRRKLGDTSQHGNWTCFRNEYHPGKCQCCNIVWLLACIGKLFFPVGVSASPAMVTQAYIFCWEVHKVTGDYSH
jgi:hypothetical protein